jgi:gliding motility-associated-like protein
VELTAGFVMPGCKDSTLRFYANSNLLEDFHWIGPNGFRSDEQNPSIEGASYLMNGTYTVWGQLDRCSPPVSFDMVVNIPDDYKKDTAMSFEFCSKDSVIVDGKVYKETGSYVDTLVASNGCDSIVSFSIERKYTEHYFKDTICYGESYEFGGAERVESGFFVETLKGANSCGCDSVVGVHLTVLPKPEYMEKEVLICQNDSFELNGSYYKGKVLVYDTIRGRFGCDSVIVEVDIDTFPANWEERPAVHFCEGFPVTIGGVAFDEDTTLIDTAVGADGCPLYIKTEVIKDLAVPLPDSFSFAGCKLSEFSLSVTEIDGASYKWTPRIYLSSDTVSNPSVRPYTNVEYKVEIKYGTCREEVPVSVEIFDVPKIVRVEQEQGDGHVVVRKGSKPYYFSFDGNSFSRDSAFSDLQAGMYQAVVEDALGCVDTANFFVFIPIIPEDHFTPNGDGVKDLWEIENIEQYDDYVIRIYDRFGKLLVEYEDQYPGWDGTYNGVDMPSTDYWYVIDLEFMDYDLSGHFTLVRK